jgi:hypothetical protein
MKGILMPGSAAKDEETQIAVRAEREKALYALWKTSVGQRQVLNLFWSNRAAQAPLQAGDSVIQLILEHEFGPCRA